MGKPLEVNPWKNMWTKPKNTIRSIVNYNPNYRIWVLSFLYGFVTLISLAQKFSLGFSLNTYIIIAFSIIFAPIIGYVIFSFFAYVVFFTGKWLKGESKYIEVRSAIAWSNILMIVNVIFWLLLFIIFQGKLFQSFPISYQLTNNETVFLFVILFLQMVASIWTIVLYVNTLAEVQKFSLAKSILNILVATIILIALFFVLSLVYNLTFRIINA